MKKLLSLLFALVVAFALTMPVFAQETPAPEAAPKAEKKKVKKAKTAKVKKEKKEKKEAPTQ